MNDTPPPVNSEQDLVSSGQDLASSGQSPIPNPQSPISNPQSLISNLQSPAASQTGRLFGIGLIALLGLLVLFLLIAVLDQPLSVMTVLWGVLGAFAVGLIGWVAYWTVALAGARYEIAGQRLVIVWGGLREVVPLAESRLTIGTPAVEQFRGVRWPGYFVGQGVLAGNPLRIYATRPLAEQVLIQTPTTAYSISPADVAAFQTAFQAGLAVEVDEGGVEAPAGTLGISGWAIWRDGLGWALLGVGLLLNVGLFVLLTAVIGRLPVLVPLHFDGVGGVDRVGNPAGLFIIPAVSLAAWFFNSTLGGYFYQLRQEPPIAYLLWGATLFIQLVAWVVIISLLT